MRESSEEGHLPLAIGHAIVDQGGRRPLRAAAAGDARPGRISLGSNMHTQNVDCRPLVAARPENPRLPRDPSDSETTSASAAPAVGTWGAVASLGMCVALLIAAEFMPVSLLTPIARDLGATVGMAGQAISISGLFAVATSLF